MPDCFRFLNKKYMGREIEYKYLVNKKLWPKVTAVNRVMIKQAYLHCGTDISIRIRIKEDGGFITIKGKAEGPVRPEFEYEIPLEDANDLLTHFSSPIIEKIRHYVSCEHKTWEVDEYLGLNAGLITAEIELSDINEKYSLPFWIEKDITGDFRYSNASLSLRPFTTW